MTAFDTDVLTGIFQGTPMLMSRFAAIPPAEQAVPVIVVEEILRGRLETVRKAEAGKTNISLERAYWLFQESFRDFMPLHILEYSRQAHAVFASWKQQKVRGTTHDLRIAAIALAHSAKLVTHNRKDFQHIPGLNVEFWT
jgi:tRNA(fMet)-specific endonuclease VapC